MKPNKHLINLIIFVLILSFVFPTGVSAAVPDEIMPLASLYLTSYTAYICPMGNGELEIWFRVVGTDDWADLGVLMIELYESSDQVNWTPVETFLHTENSQMLVHDYDFCMSHVDYDDATAKMYYKAYVCIWGGDETNGDTRYIWTPVERAT